MPIDPQAEIEITAYEWVPEFAQGHVRDLRPRWACEEAGLSYRVRLISAIERPDWYYDEQPWGQVPYLRDGDICVFESGATLIHLAERSGKLLAPGGQARASALSWLLAAYNSVEPYLMELANVDVLSREEEWAQLRRSSLVETVGKRLDRMQAHLGEFEWLAGEFSIADIAMTCALRSVSDAKLLESRPSLAAYVARASGRPAFRRAMDAQLEVFAQHAPSLSAQGA